VEKKPKDQMYFFILLVGLIKNKFIFTMTAWLEAKGLLWGRRREKRMVQQDGQHRQKTLVSRKKKTL
jgi:hypothetical protein